MWWAVYGWLLVFNKKSPDSEVAEVDMTTDIGMIKKILFGFNNEGFN